MLYIAQEPDFFETMRAVFALPDTAGWRCTNSFPRPIRGR
jgi:hypothetical protein